MPEARGEKVFLVGVTNRATPRALAEEHLDELERLVETAGGRTAGRYLKDRASPDPATYIGKGGVEEIGNAAREAGVALVIFDDELTPAQARNLEERWGGNVHVLDRPGLILDVFASHARSREARTQVELAQLQYLLPRLAGQYGHLSRLGGGIGGRGAGEQKIELDRRKIRDRISRLRGDLAAIETARSVRKKGRRDQFQVAIAGYTNAGKTTLFNRLTREAAYAADRLFATLDARVAKARTPKLRNTVFIDTVGFVRKLPTSLVASFRSTLAEIRDADLVLHVLDGSSPRVDEERRVAAEVLEELGVDAGKILTVWNKQDISGSRPEAFAIPISGKTGEGIGRLETEILSRARPESGVFLLRIPYTRGDAIARARARFRVVSEKDEGDGLLLEVAGDRLDLPPFAEYAAKAGPRRAVRRKTKGGAIRLPPAPELPRRRSY